MFDTNNTYVSKSISLGNFDLKTSGGMFSNTINSFSTNKTEVVKESTTVFSSNVSKEMNRLKIQQQLNTLSPIVKANVFKHLVSEVFINALLIDKSIVNATESQLRGIIDTYVDENGGYELLTSKVEEGKFPILAKIKNVCDNIAMEVFAKKSKEAQDDTCEAIDFSLDDEDKEVIDTAKKDLSLDELSELVKDKVLSVVKDEKNRQIKEDAMLKEIEDELINSVDGDTEEEIKEALSTYIIQKSPIKESTLFNALTLVSYKEVLQENVSVMDDGSTGDNQVGTVGSEFSDEQLEYSSIDMDMVLAEAITKYTLMETLYTLGLEDYSHGNIQKLVQKILM